jgi:hypothetical protein
MIAVKTPAAPITSPITAIATTRPINRAKGAPLSGIGLVIGIAHQVGKDAGSAVVAEPTRRKD